MPPLDRDDDLLTACVLDSDPDTRTEARAGGRDHRTDCSPMWVVPWPTSRPSATADRACSSSPTPANDLLTMLAAIHGYAESTRQDSSAAPYSSD